MNDEERPVDATEIDWHEVARKALGSAMVAAFVGGAMQALSDIVLAEVRAARKRRRPIASIQPGDDEAVPDEIDEAAALLGISRHSSESEIRAALRARLVSSRLHPDHGGDGEEAKRLIAAQNLLIQHARERAEP